MIAPVWWIHSTSAAYSAIKYLNAFVMPLAAIPTYLLARMLVTKRAAVVVAVGSVAVPAMAYVTSIVPEVLAYPYFALCSWLAVRALQGGPAPRRDHRRRLPRSAATSSGSGSSRRSRSRSPSRPPGSGSPGRAAGHSAATGRRGDTLGALVLAFGVAILFNRVVLQHIQEWQVTTQYYKNRMVDLGLRAGLSFAIGLGVLPVIGGLVSLRLPERRGDPTYRAFAAWTAAAIGVLGALHSRQGRVPLDELRDALGGAQPDLPLAAAAARHRDGLRGEAARLAGRRRGHGLRRW